MKPSFRFPARFALVWASLAAALLPAAASAITLLPKCATTSDPNAAGQCGVSDILAVLVNLAEYLLGIMGAVALGFFIYGGFTWVLSGGEKDKVQKGKDILRNAVTGIAIIFLAGVIVRFTTRSLTGGKSVIPIVGEDCKVGNQSGIFVSVPGGFKGGVVVPEGIECISKSKGCDKLNALLKERGRSEVYACMSLTQGEGKTCVRGICPGGADNVCCLK
jgi:hypothetical protein